MPDAHERRRAALCAQLAELDAEAALITRLVNVRYLTGFTGSNAALLVSPTHSVLATDGRYRVQAGAQAPDVSLLVERECASALLAQAGRFRRVGFEAHDVTVESYEQLAAVYDGELVPVRRAVEKLRVIKDDDEIDLLRQACAIADRALADLLPHIRAGRSERDIAVQLETLMHAHGAEAPAFDTIVASGPNSAIPHHRAGDRLVESGDLLKLDFGARYEGYHSDMTRTFCVGNPREWQRELHELVARAQRAGRDAVRPGADAREVDRVARQVIEQAGHGEHYPHSLGHGVGLEIHEAPTLGYNTAATLEERMPVTVEPGVYLDGRGGVRIEDTVVVRPGAPEILTTSTREMVVLG